MTGNGKIFNNPVIPLPHSLLYFSSTVPVIVLYVGVVLVVRERLRERERERHREGERRRFPNTFCSVSHSKKKLYCEHFSNILLWCHFYW